MAPPDLFAIKEERLVFSLFSFTPESHFFFWSRQESSTSSVVQRSHKNIINRAAGPTRGYLPSPLPPLPCPAPLSAIFRETRAPLRSDVDVGLSPGVCAARPVVHTGRSGGRKVQLCLGAVAAGSVLARRGCVSRPRVFFLFFCFSSIFFCLNCLIKIE